MRKTALVALVALAVLGLPPSGSASEPSCSKAEIRGLVRSFVKAHNRGDTDYLDRIWARDPHFFWYSVDSDVLRRGSLAEDRDTLSFYFTERALYGDQLHLEKMSVEWERGWHQAWAISFELHRTSDQLGSAGAYRGEAAATCGSDGQLLHAWQMHRRP